MFAVGVLAFLFVDVLEHGFAIVEDALIGFKDDERGFGDVVGLTLLFTGGFAFGSAGLATLERRLRPSRPLPPIAGGSTEVMSPADVTIADRADAERRSWAL